MKEDDIMSSENQKVDILENRIFQTSEKLFSILLKDRTSKKNILWCTDNYLKYGKGYYPTEQIKPEMITGRYGRVIKPRTRKSQKDKKYRIKQKGEVFTPSWTCNKQNNFIDEQWFGVKGVFNDELEEKWNSNKNRIPFISLNKEWSEYVLDVRLEITCGEAPYLISRYDTVTGEVIEPINRIGIIDRKIRVINENTSNKEEWIEWVKKAYQSSYGFEWQGDSLLISRENLLYTFNDYYYARFDENPSIDLQIEIATIISWNIWQMDGLKGVIPMSCNNDKLVQLDLFGEEVREKCSGCKNGDIRKHNGNYCLIKDWTKTSNPSHRYIDLV